MAVQIRMQLGILSLVGQGNHELAGVHTGTTERIQLTNQYGNLPYIKLVS